MTGTSTPNHPRPDADRFHAYAGDTDVTEDALQDLVDWTDAPFRSGGPTTVCFLILVGFVVGYFGLRALGAF